MENTLGVAMFIGTLEDQAEYSARNLLWRTTDPGNIYRLFIDAVESPLIKEVMNFTGNNQTQAAKLLGIARGSLITKLKKHGLFDYSNCKQETEEQQEIDSE
jgi:DNA-binding protein Fis